GRLGVGAAPVALAIRDGHPHLTIRQRGSTLPFVFGNPGLPGSARHQGASPGEPRFPRPRTQPTAPAVPDDPRRRPMTDKPTKIQKTSVAEPAELPVLPLRDVVVFPHMVIPLFVGREKSVRALEIAMAGNKQILLVAQRSP